MDPRGKYYWKWQYTLGNYCNSNDKKLNGPKLENKERYFGDYAKTKKILKTEFLETYFCKDLNKKYFSFIPKMFYFIIISDLIN